ncbi:hypothetical protein BJV82DRAFT_631905 [Fennellomyces sp. T-0311]|nr:hypothetical protein BJV82DRAFT_631905 [Fennellomyces sp. T-0311]
MAGTIQPKESQWGTHTVQKTITEQYDLIQSSLRALDRSQIKIRPGVSSLDADHVAISAGSIDCLDSEQVAGWSVVWGNKRLPVSGSCHSHTHYPDFYYEFMALREAMRATPNDQSIILIANTMILVNYMKHKRVVVKGEDVVGEKYQMLEPLIIEIEHMIKSRTGKVSAVMVHEDLSWLMQLKDSAAAIALAEQQSLRWSMSNTASRNVTSDDNITANSTDDNSRTDSKSDGKRAKRRHRTRPLFKEAHPNPQFITSEPPTIHRADEHQLPFIQVPRRRRRKTSTQLPEKAKKVERHSQTVMLDRVGEGPSVATFGGSPASTTEADDSSRKRQAEYVVPMEFETHKKQKGDALASDTDGRDVHEGALEHL